MATKNQKERQAIRYSSAKKRVEEHDKQGAPTAYKVPKGWDVFKFEEAKKFYLDVLPFVATSSNKFVEEGQVHYEWTYYVHDNLGPDNIKLPCPLRNWGEKCPVCEERERIYRDREGDKDYAKTLFPKERQLWIVRDREEKKFKPMLMELAHFGKGEGFGEKIDALMDDAGKGEPALKFFHLKDGMTLRITAGKDSFKGRAFYKAKTITLIPREEDYDESILDKMPALDSLPVRVSYKDLKKAFDGGTDAAVGDQETEEETEEETDDEEEGEGPAAEKGIFVGCKVKHDEFGKCEVVHVSGDGTSLRVEDEEGEVHKAVDPDDCELIKKTGGKKPKDEEEEEDDEETPPAKKPGKKPKDDEEEDEEDDEEEEEDDDDPPAKKPGKKPKEEEEEDDDDDDPLDDDEDEDEEEEDDDPPAKKPKPGAKTPGKK